MAVDIDYFLSEKYDELLAFEEGMMFKLYDNVSHPELSKIFAVLHYNINDLFVSMKDSFSFNKHYNANESRCLLDLIGIYEELRSVLNNTDLSFEIDDEYEKKILFCKTFLSHSGGSEIPESIKFIELKKYSPIFHLKNLVIVDLPSNKKYPLNLIGEGSYAKVFVYKDEFYNQRIALKRAKGDLSEKELERFRREFKVMTELNHLNILKVYSYNEKNKEYFLEFADETLENYINKNNNKMDIRERIELVKQVFDVFSYIRSKDIFHRDISLTNVLIKYYDNSKIIKISDFGLVKEQHSNLTSFGTEIKGSLNDSNLEIIGFKNYSTVHETYALTRLIFFIMTGKTNLYGIQDERLRKFVLKGINVILEKRYKSIAEMKECFFEIYNQNV